MRILAAIVACLALQGCLVRPHRSVSSSTLTVTRTLSDTDFAREWQQVHECEGTNQVAIKVEPCPNGDIILWKILHPGVYQLITVLPAPKPGEERGEMKIIDIK